MDTTTTPTIRAHFCAGMSNRDILELAGEIAAEHGDLDLYEMPDGTTVAVDADDEEPEGGSWNGRVYSDIPYDRDE